MKENTGKITCEVVNDLLPLYYDGVCSDDSCRIVEEHLRDCKDCRKLFEKIQSDCGEIQKQEQEKEHVMQDMACVWKKTVFRSFLKGIVAAFVVLFSLAACWALINWPFINIPPDEVEASVEVEDSRFIIQLDTSNRYKVPSPDMTVTEDGELYFTLKHALIPVNFWKDKDYGGTYASSMDMETDTGHKVRIKSIYYGTEDDSILLWKSDCYDTRLL